MSGHSKWATIHRQKGVKDQARGKLFSKMARLVTIAAKTGNGPNPESNPRLREIIEKARSVNMPKENIERAISKAADPQNLEEVTYEGFGPNGINLMIEAATDNRNRTGQEIKNALEKGGGSLGGPGSAAFNFEHCGFLLVEKATDSEGQMLSIMDLNVVDVFETQDGIEVYCKPAELYEIRKKLEDLKFIVLETQLIYRPKNMLQVSPEASLKIVNFLEELEEHDDVQNIYTNVSLN